MKCSFGPNQMFQYVPYYIYEQNSIPCYLSVKVGLWRYNVHVFACESPILITIKLH
jgi:hypothetical protein